MSDYIVINRHNCYYLAVLLWSSNLDCSAGESVAKYIREPSPFNTQIVSLGVDTYLKMLLADNFVHTDLHPGNIMVRIRGVSHMSHTTWSWSTPAFAALGHQEGEHSLTKSSALYLAQSLVKMLYKN